MKRSQLRRKMPLKRSKLRSKRGLRAIGAQTIPQLKKSIQALLREVVIKRDGGCVLRHFPQAGHCGGYRNDGKLILQAEHLVSRAKSVCFADSRNAVCLCKNHHIFFKKRNGSLYWSLIQTIIGPERWKLHEQWRDDKTPHHVTAGEWRMAEFALQEELAEL